MITYLLLITAFVCFNITFLWLENRRLWKELNKKMDK